MKKALVVVIVVVVVVEGTVVVLRHRADPWPGLRPGLMKMLEDAGKPGVGNPSQIPLLLSRAQEQYKRAQSVSDMDAVLETYREVLRIDPMNYEALSQTALKNLMKGNLFLDDVNEKRRCYFNGMIYAALAMSTNPAFKARITKGEWEWEAFKKDLEWVVSQDLDLGDRREPYNIIFQKRAREALEKIDRYF